MPNAAAMTRTTIVSVGMDDSFRASGAIMLAALAQALILIKIARTPSPPLWLRADHHKPPSGRRGRRSGRAYITGCPEGSPGQGAESPANRHRGNPLNLIRVMPAKGQDMPTAASPRISLFLARLLGPLFLA